jgi:hypothetical protein
LERCPLHPEGGCGLAAHGSYARVRPAGIRVARLRCPKARITISLLPDFLAARLSGTLAEVEQTVEAVAGALSLAAVAPAAVGLRPGSPARRGDPRAGALGVPADTRGGA